MQSDESEGNAMLPSARPAVSVIMANYNGSKHLADAVGSVLAQTVDDIEVIIVDDASTDESGEIIRLLAATDARVRAVLLTPNGGPARARNRGLDLAQGEWIAIVDADDLITPDRFERLMEAAEKADVDVVADDLLYFVDGAQPHARLLQHVTSALPLFVTAEMFVRGRSSAGESVAFGYLKPLIRSTLLGGKRYDVTLTIGEDYDLLLRLLLEGGDLCVVREAMYRYRRHSKSLSHRLSAPALRAMIASQDRFVAHNGPFATSLAAAFQQRRTELLTRVRFEELVAAIKARRVMDAVASMLRHPALLPRLGQSFAEGLTRRLRGKAAG